MSEEIAFLAAIRANPSDLTARGVYADWLEEQGDPRAGFVRLVMSLADAASRMQEVARNLDPEWVRLLAYPWPSGPRVLNRIGAIRAPSKHVSEPHLAIAVDGVQLDVALGSKAKVLLSSRLKGFHNYEDSAGVWKRILPSVGSTSYATLLGSDDLDLHGIFLVAEVVSEPDVVRWDKLGFATESCVRWEPGWGPYCFDRAEYEACLAAFRPPMI